MLIPLKFHHLFLYILDIIREQFTALANKRMPKTINGLNAELNPICYLLALLGAHHFLHVSKIRVK